MEKLGGTTVVIDSGEAEIDPNRKVFDGLVPYKVYKAFLYKVWGRGMFIGHSWHVETIVLLSHKKSDGHINEKVEFGEGEGNGQI